jgi:hypothetical protein
MIVSILSRARHQMFVFRFVMPAVIGGMVLMAAGLARAQTEVPAAGAYSGKDSYGDEMQVVLEKSGTDLQIGKMEIAFTSDRQNPLVLGKDHQFGINKANGVDFAVCPLMSDIWAGIDPSRCYIGHIQNTSSSFLGTLFGRTPPNSITVTLRKPAQVFSFSRKNSDGGFLSDEVAKGLRDEYEFVLSPRQN